MHSSPKRFSVGDILLPRSVTDVVSAGYPHGASHAESLGQLNSNAVYVTEGSDWRTLREVLREPGRWIYRVDPIGELGDDPESGWASASARTCCRAVVTAILRSGSA